MFINQILEKKDFDLISAYIDEYKIVTNKITSLSLKFSNGSYIIPISLIAGIASLTLDHLIVNIILIIAPVVLTLFIYNHVRYMALQFKLSGYAKHLEIRINEILNENVFLWENTIARDNGQNLYEGVFLGITYVFSFILVYYLSYKRLTYMFFEDDISYAILFIIITIYYFSITSLIFFLMFFTNEHTVSFQKASEAFKTAITIRTNCSFSISWKKMIPKLITVLFILSLYPISLFPLVCFSYENATATKDYDYIVVLGNKSKNNIPSQDMKSRLDCLISYVDKHDNLVIVLSGGNGESSLMRDYLIDSGFSDLQIITEGDSLNTYENFVNVKQIVSNNILVITSDYHIFRANLICRKLGLNYDFLAAKSKGIPLFKILKECYAVCVDLWRIL